MSKISQNPPKAFVQCYGDWRWRDAGAAGVVIKLWDKVLEDFACLYKLSFHWW